MTSTLIIIIITALAAKGWQYATYTPETYDMNTNRIIKFNKTQDPEILWWVRYYLGNFIIKILKHHAEKILKPLFLCSVCACGFSSVVLCTYANIYFETQISFTQWVVIAISATGLATLIRD